jgi:hypothetical protein
MLCCESEQLLLGDKLTCNKFGTCSTRESTTTLLTVGHLGLECKQASVLSVMVLQLCHQGVLSLLQTPDYCIIFALGIILNITSTGSGRQACFYLPVMSGLLGPARLACQHTPGEPLTEPSGFLSALTRTLMHINKTKKPSKALEGHLMPGHLTLSLPHRIQGQRQAL